MTKILHFTGFIRGVKYKACLSKDLSTSKVTLDEFNVNHSKAYGIIQLENTEIAYSTWVSPKRTRSYPFARIYNTYNASKILTIIPIIKDEGKDGDLDKLQYSTISWMNLLNIYIVLGYYEDAKKSDKKGQSHRDKLTQQKFNNEFVKSQIQEIVEYKQSALHWNKNLFEERFVEIFNQSLNSYTKISEATGVLIHSHTLMEQYLKKVTENFEEFKNISLKGSQEASNREALTSHNLEHLVDGIKATFCIKNYLGGTYYLTPDEIIKVKMDNYIIQESKNSTKSALPSMDDIQDGLFKLILFSNIDSLELNNEKIDFSVRLKLTGKNIKSRLILPASSEEINNFIQTNSTVFNKNQNDTIIKLAQEARHNQKIQIEIVANNQ